MNGDTMLTELITKIAVAFFASMFAAGFTVAALSPLALSAAQPGKALLLAMLGGLLALLAGAGWYCAENDLHALQWRHNRR